MEEIQGPQTLYLRVTENCNARCFMCGFSKAKNKQYIQQGSVDDIAQRAAESGIRLVRLTGGEPLLGDIHSLLYSFKNRGLLTSVITNGFLLPEKFQELTDGGLDQLVVSLDGSGAEVHDRLRSLPGLFKKLTLGIEKIREVSPNLNIRVNTVASPLNLNDLGNILDLLGNLGVDQWSIIPIKGGGNWWLGEDQKTLVKTYTDFSDYLKGICRPKLLGYSREWAGRYGQEVERYFTTGRTFTPQKVCRTVELVRFYMPLSDSLLPCNCLPHRFGKLNLENRNGLQDLSDGTLNGLVDYLKTNGPNLCSGCEPLNAYLGEHPGILEEDIFMF